MARNPTWTDAAKNAMLDAGLDRANGGFIDFYGGVKPASPSVPSDDTLEAVRLSLGNPAFSPASGGQKTANAISSAVVTSSQDVRWFRIWQSDGVTAVHDGTVGTIDAGCDATVGTTQFVAGVLCTCPSLVITIP